MGSSVPAAIDALVAALQAADLDGAGLFDGPRVITDWNDAAITVGYTDENNESVTMQRQPEGLAVTPNRERFSIRCEVFSRCAALDADGSPDIAAARQRAYDLLDVVDAVLAANHTLGGVVLSAVLGTSTFDQGQNETDGAVAQILFDVDCDAYTTR